MKIGVFDSGIGGLTVLKELINNYPNNEYVYYGDTANLPYGDKNYDELYKYATHAIDFLIEKGATIIVVACGTISSTVYSKLLDKYNIPITNVIIPTITKIKEDGIKDIAVLATSKTINTHIFKNSLNGVNVLEVECSKFVPLIEGPLLINKDKLIKKYLEIVKKKNINNIVLGCTHYPLLEDDIKKYLGDVNIYNMGVILSNSVFFKSTHYSLDVYFSKIYNGLENKVNKLLNSNINIIKE